MSWYVRNVREMKWWDRGRRGFVAEFVDDEDAQVGVNLFVLGPGEVTNFAHAQLKRIENRNVLAFQRIS